MAIPGCGDGHPRVRRLAIPQAAFERAVQGGFQGPTPTPPHHEWEGSIRHKKSPRPYEGRGRGGVECQAASEARPELSPILAGQFVPAANGGIEKVRRVAIQESRPLLLIGVPPGTFHKHLFALCFVEEILLSFL